MRRSETVRAGMSRRALLAGGAALAGGRLLSGCGGPAADGRTVIGMAQVSSFPALDNAREGYLAALKAGGYEDGKTARILLKNAQGDIPTLMLIMQEFLGQNVDLIATVSTAALQAALKATSEIPIVFSAVANPYVAGAGESDDNHRPNVTGVYSALPVDKALRLAHQLLPHVQKFGTLYDPADVFTETLRKLAAKTAAELNVEIVEVSASSSNEIMAGVQALKARGAEAIMQLPAIVVYTAMESEIKEATNLGLPIISVEPNHVTSGALAAIGWDYHQVGQEAGQLAVKVLKGEKPASMPMRSVTRETLGLNKQVAAKYGVTLPPDLLKKAETVVE